MKITHKNLSYYYIGEYGWEKRAPIGYKTIVVEVYGRLYCYHLPKESSLKDFKIAFVKSAVGKNLKMFGKKGYYFAYENGGY